MFHLPQGVVRYCDVGGVVGVYDNDRHGAGLLRAMRLLHMLALGDAITVLRCTWCS